MKTETIPTKHWYRQRFVALVLGIVSATFAYSLGLRALETGSLQQYAVVFALIIIAVSRLVHAARRTRA